jgi:SAM-dependent methyltransferase
MDLTESPPGKVARHPWELARAACILGLIEERDFKTVADIGAGDLYFARELLNRHRVSIMAVDTGYERVTQMDGILRLTNLSDVADGSLDLAFLMDVLEHEQDDRRLLEEALRKLAPGGHLLITVPAFEFLFSAHDVFLGHCRRYRRRQLHDLLRGLDVELVQSFYFFASLFLLRCLQVLFAKSRLRTFGKGVSGWTFAQDHPMTRGLVALLKADFALGRRLALSGIYLPGLSICQIIRKKSAS